MEKLVYDADEETLGDMRTQGLILGVSSSGTEESDSVANETVDAGVAFRRVVVEKSD